MRQRLLKFTALWSSFKIADASYEGPHDAIACAIARIAGRPPARLSIFGPADVSSGSFIGLISDWMSTLEVLRARFHMESSDSVDHQQFAAVTDALARPAPKLDTFEIPPGLSVSEVYELPTSFLGATAGRLRRCGLAKHTFGLERAGIIPRTVNLITFKLVTNGTAGHSIDVSHLQTLLDSLPLLENFAHTFKRFTAIADGSTPPTLRLPPRLKNVSIINYSSGPVGMAREIKECTQLRRTLAGVSRSQEGSRTCDHHLRCPMLLDDIGDLVSWLIGADRRLVRLVLGGITDIVDGDPATALGRLESMTETIEVVEQPPRDVVQDCRMSPHDGVYPGMRSIDCFSFEDDFSWRDSIDRELRS